MGLSPSVQSYLGVNGATMNRLLVLILLFATAITAMPVSSAETAIRNIIDEQFAAWKTGDGVAYARHFAEEGTFTKVRGQFFTGRKAFIGRHDFPFKGQFHGSTLKQDIVSLNFVRPDVAVVEVLTSVTGFQSLPLGTSVDDKGRLRTRLLQVIVKEKAEWKVVPYHDTDVKSDIAAPEPQYRERGVVAG